MNPRLKSIAHLPSVGCTDNSSFHVCDLSPGGRNGSPTFSESSTIENEAALLLSIANICDREVKDRGFDAIFEEMPQFPSLVGSNCDVEAQSPLKPRPELVHLDEKIHQHAFRARSVSIDSPRLEGLGLDRTTSPVSLPATKLSPEPVLVSPVTPHAAVRRFPSRKQSIRLVRQTRRNSLDTEPEKDGQGASMVSSKNTKGRTLQASPPKGVPIKKIGRKKFSWKCYPEVGSLYDQFASPPLYQN